MLDPLLTPIQETVLFVSKTVFNIYLGILLIKFLIDLLHIKSDSSIYNIINISTKPLGILDKIIPKLGRFNLSALLAILLLQIIKILIGIVVVYEHVVNPLGLIMWSLGDLLAFYLNMYSVLLIIAFALNFLIKENASIAAKLLLEFTEPITKIVNKFLPKIVDFDIAPIVIVITMQLLRIWAATPLVQQGVYLALN